MTTTQPSLNVGGAQDVDRRKNQRVAIPVELSPPVVLHCGMHKIPVTVTQFSERGICLQTELHDIAVLVSDPVSVGDHLHVEFRDELYEGVARHVTPKSGALAVGIEWTAFTAHEEPHD